MKSVGLTSVLPAAGGDGKTTFVAEGYVAPEGANMNLATPVTMQGDYLQAMGIPLLGGRLFTQADTADTQLVAIVNHKLAAHYWPGSNPLGKRIRMALRRCRRPG